MMRSGTWKISQFKFAVHLVLPRSETFISWSHFKFSFRLSHQPTPCNSLSIYASICQYQLTSKRVSSSYPRYTVRTVRHLVTCQIQLKPWLGVDDRSGRWNPPRRGGRNLAFGLHRIHGTPSSEQVSSHEVVSISSVLPGEERESESPIRAQSYDAEPGAIEVWEVEGEHLTMWLQRAAHIQKCNFGLHYVCMWFLRLLRHN